MPNRILSVTTDGETLYYTKHYWNAQPDNSESLLKQQVFLFLPYFFDHRVGKK